jgi:hypothetical protein
VRDPEGAELQPAKVSAHAARVIWEISRRSAKARGGSAVPTVPGAEMNLMPTRLVFERCSNPHFRWTSSVDM